VRSTFIEFFRQRNHRFVPSSSVIPKKNDGSYFVNAGMNQVKIADSVFNTHDYTKTVCLPDQTWL